jgi:uncharacterized membrane protein YfcA
MYVPALIICCGSPSTSLFILTVTTFTGSATHVAADLFHHGIRRVIMLSVGAVIGAQFGAKIAARIQEAWIVRVLAITLALVGLRIIASVL